MKKIMVYSKHGIGGGITDALKDGRSLLFFYTCFVCALLTGSALYTAAGSGSVLEKATGILLTNKIENTAVMLLVCVIICVFVNICAGLSCAGVLLLVFLPLAEGLVNSFILSYLLSSQGAKGLGFFTLLILPGALIFVTATLGMCAVNAQTSKKICGILFFDQRESFQLKDYLIKNAVLLFVLITAVLLLFLSYKMFSGLF